MRDKGFTEATESKLFLYKQETDINISFIVQRGMIH